MNIHWHDIVGSMGVIMVILAYLFLQIGRLKSDAVLFSVINGLGAALIILSLTQSFNLSAFLIELFWVLISIYGIVRNWKRKPAKI